MIVIANALGRRCAAIATAALIGCTSVPSTGDIPATSSARREVPAPIEAAELLVRESFPLQYAVRVTSGLPSGCAVFDRIDIERAANVVELTVWNTLPADRSVACTMIYGTSVNTVDLGSDFESGRSYEVHINGEAGVNFMTP
ncbi:MAG TPA: hypothetical protein VGC50_06305 [Gammaproteobacteria bacterium]|jgi:hypothetical protein